MNPFRRVALKVFFASLLMLLLQSCASFLATDGPSRTTLAADRVALPTSSDESNQLSVDVRINGAGPFRLMVDTGCSSTLLSAEVARTAGLVPLPGKGRPGFNASNQMSWKKRARVDRLESDGFTVEAIVVGLLEDKEIADITALAGRPVAGFLGMSTLKDVVLEMDFPNRRVSVLRSGTQDYAADRRVPYRSLFRVPLVTVQVGDQPIVMQVDTGSNGGFEIPKLGAVPLLNPPVKAEGYGAQLGENGGPRGQDGQLAGDARLGPVTWTNPPLGGMGHRSATGRMGVDVLNSWRVAFDQKARRIYFLGDVTKREWPAGTPVDVRFSLGFFAEIEGTALRLLEVDAGSAADLSGLRAGDLVLEIDGSPATRSPAKSHRRTMRVVRDGREFETVLVNAPDYTPRQTILAADRVALPTGSARGILMVDAQINGAGPYRFVVGIGNSSLRVGRHVVEKSGLKPQVGWTGAGPSAATAPQVVWVDAFQSAGLQLKGLAATVVSDEALETAIGLYGPIDGYLGLEPLKDAILEVNFPASLVSVVRRGAETLPEDRGVEYHGTGARVPLEIAGMRGLVLLGTASNTFFEIRTLDRLPLHYPATKTDGVGYTSTSTRGERGQIAAEARVGPIIWENALVQRGRSAVIGARALSTWKLAIDQHAQKVYFLGGDLRRTWKVQAPTGDASGRPGYYLKMHQGELHVSEIDAGGTLDRAGVRVGDIILAVDGVRAADIPRGTLSFSRGGPRRLLRVRRDGAEIEIELNLANGRTAQQVPGP